MSKNHDIIQSIRSFNRFYTSKLGILNPQMLDTEYSLIEGRILYEIGTGRPIARDLTKVLSIDEGYLSRIIKKFEKKALIKRTQDDKDTRRRYLELTTKGKEAFKILNSRADRQIEILLNTLTERERKDLEKALKMLEFLMPT